MELVATAIFEQQIHHAWCRDARNPTSPRLVIDAVTRPGDLDGPLRLTVAMFRVFAGAATEAALRRLRSAGRIMVDDDGVAYVTFSTWTFADDAPPPPPPQPPPALEPPRADGPGR